VLGLFGTRNKRDRGDAQGFALAGGGPRRSASSARATTEPPTNSHRTRPPHSTVLNLEELNFKLERIESEYFEALERGQRALEEAGHILLLLESGAGAAEAYAERSARLAARMARCRRQEAQFLRLIDKIGAAERRALAADERTRAAIERIPDGSSRSSD
jgi:hypothetical protein